MLAPALRQHTYGPVPEAVRLMVPGRGETLAANLKLCYTDRAAAAAAAA
eukprot:COSAG03_NODE_22596_length_289_cov_0.810526_2_plen_48_part_01